MAGETWPIIGQSAIPTEEGKVGVVRGRAQLTMSKTCKNITGTARAVKLRAPLVAPVRAGASLGDFRQSGRLHLIACGNRLAGEGLPGRSPAAVDAPMTKLPALAALAALAFAGAAHAQEQQPARVNWEFSTGLDYSVGEYGAETDTEVLYVPFTARARSERWRVEATVPYLRIEGPGNVVSASGSPIFIPPGTTQTREGLGDVFLGAGWTVQPASQGRPSLELFGTVKAPTADDDLGTGETDVSLSLNLNHRAGDKLSLTAGLGYEWLGDPAAYELEDGPIGYVGVSYDQSERFSFGGSVNFRHRVAEGFDDQISATPWASWRFGRTAALTGYGTIGFTEASPDYGVGLQLTLYR